MADIDLVRHGQDEDNLEGILNGHRDRPLTDLGRQQARTLAGKLNGSGVQVVYASPLRRAYETAAIIAEALGLAVQVDQDLIERDFGVLTGQPVASILDLPADQVLHTEGVNYFLEAEGSEDFPTLYARAGRVLTRMHEKHPKGHVLLVAHGDIGKMVRAVYYGWDWKAGLMTPYLDNTGVLELRAASGIVG